MLHFLEVESVIASTNSNDSKPMLNLFDNIVQF
jgi:hypothetical protein